MGLYHALLAQAVEPSGFIYWVDKVARTSLSKILIFALVLTAVRLIVYSFLKNTPVHRRTGLYSFAKIANEACDALVYASIVVFMLVRPFGIQTFHIPTGSMLQTLHERDFIIANKMIYRYTDPKVGDIVVFHPPDIAFQGNESPTDYIKRLVGAPGDVIEWKDMVLYRNGKAVDEPYVYYHDQSFGDSPPYTKLPKDRWDEVQLRNFDFKLIEHDGKVIPLMYKGDIIDRIHEEFQVRDPSDPDGREKDLIAINKPAAKIPDGYYLFMGDHRNGSRDSRIWGLASRDNIIGRSEYVMLPFNRIGSTD